MDRKAPSGSEVSTRPNYRRPGGAASPAGASLAGFLALALSGCGSSLAPESPATARPVAHHAVDGTVQTVRYRAGEGFVPSRIDVETGARVVLINESGESFLPRFAVRQGHDHSAAGTDDSAGSGNDGSHGAQGGHGDHGAREDPGGAVWEISPGRSTVDRWTYKFDVSGYWRFRNELNPDHAGLVVALPGPDTALEPLVMEHEERSFPDPPPPTVEGGAGLLRDREALREFMEAYGPRNALAALRRAELETGLDCHHSAHHLGRMAFAEYGPAASATVTDVCQSGMRHGVIEQLFVTRGISNLAEDVASMCSSTDDEFTRYQCLHGVGHGVMAWTAYELEDALELCEQLGDEWSQTSCYTGVFMENVAGGLSASGRISAYVDPEDPHYPCNRLPDRYVDDCYWYQTSQMLFVFDNDLLRVAEACAEAPTAGRRHCFGSYGRDVSGAHRDSPHRIVQFCGEAPSPLFRADCIDGAARTLFWDSTQRAAGLRLCELVEEGVVADTCYESIVRQAHLVLPNPDLDPFCRELPDRWRNRCRAPATGP